jgi:hypothetical protein
MMPVITRWYVKTSLVYLVLALGTGLLLAVRPLGGLFPVYFHLLTLGWLTFLIFGVVLWMFPKFSREKPRGSETLGWAVYGLLNIGLILRAFSEPLNVSSPGSVWGWLLVVSALLQWLAGILFVINTWPRVKER